MQQIRLKTGALLPGLHISHLCRIQSERPLLEAVERKLSSLQPLHSTPPDAGMTSVNEIIGMPHVRTAVVRYGRAEQTIHRNAQGKIAEGLLWAWPCEWHRRICLGRSICEQHDPQAGLHSWHLTSNYTPLHIQACRHDWP